MAAHASNDKSCVNVSTSTNSERDRNSDVGEGDDTELNVTDVGVVLKVVDPILLCERYQSIDDEDHSGLKSDENSCENVDSKVGVVCDFELHGTLPNIQNEEMEPQLIIPDLLPGRIQQLVGEMQSGLESVENSYENVDSKVGVICDSLPNVYDGETEPQLKVPDVFPGKTPLMFDQVNSGLESDENSFQDEDSKIGVICDNELDDIKPHVHDVESQQIDPDALRGRMQRMVDKIHSGLAVLCSSPLTTPACFHSPQTSTNRPLQVSTERTKRVLRLGKKIRFHCLKCSKIFKDQSGFEDHQKSHRRKELYLCPYCRRVFNYGFKLRDHMAMHAGEKSEEYCEDDQTSHRRKKCYICPYCQRVFKNGVKLRDHITIHTGEKPFQCGLCGAGFRRNASLQNHKRVHTGERKYRCVKCGKKFKYSSNLSKHKGTCRSRSEVQQSSDN